MSRREGSLPIRPQSVAREDAKGPPVHPPEPAYPCCLPALGEFGGMTPHGGSATDPTL